jgi:flagellar hook protein FlgE
MFTGLTGLSVNSHALDVTGNNVANVNTVAFKSETVTFQTEFYRTFTLGGSPTDTFGGTNPSQAGMGVRVSSTSRNMTDGSPEPTGIATHMAIQGDGLFVLENPNGERRYTRDGSFKLNSYNFLVTANGDFVQGFAVDEDFNVIPGSLEAVEIPVGQMTIARATTEGALAGNLNTNGALGTTGSVWQTQSMNDTTGPLSMASNLVDLEDAATLASLFSHNDVIEFQGTKGGRQLEATSATVWDPGMGAPPADLVTVGTLQDLADLMREALGIHVYSPVTGPTPGITLNGDQLEITGDFGLENELDFGTGTFKTNGVGEPFTFSQTVNADGESVYTSFVAYDSLGTRLSINATIVFESSDLTGTVWRFFINSADDTDRDLDLGTGTLTFDNNGRLVTATGTQISLDRVDTGATSPLVFDMDFSAVTALAAVRSEMALTTQDGVAAGTLNEFGVAPDGTITGVFSNGLSTSIGQLALATFVNPQGLVNEGSNKFTIGPNSGEPIITTPQQLGAGSILGAALELSNVDLSREFVQLIVSSTGFTAASRVITTADRLLSELLATVR